MQFPTCFPLPRGVKFHTGGLTWLRGQMAGSRLEFSFYPEWKGRADFAPMDSQTLIEIEGGIFIRSGGRHSRGAGYAKNAEKYLEAVLAGWTVIRLTRKQSEIDFIERIVELLRQSSSSEETISERNRRTE